jgi:hypothetical protein
MKKSAILLVLIGIVLLIQIIPVNRTNPKVTSEIAAGPQVRDILKRSCYDCHSFASAWPWYSYVAPVSWLIVGHVNEGRSKLNFSTWDKHDVNKQQRMLEEIGDEIKNDDMPLSSYLLLHKKAKLSETDKAIINRWLAGLSMIEKGRI